MSKYIIKNCPAFAKGIFCKGGDIIDNGCADKTLDRNTLISCQDRTDCVLKQIYEMCKSQKESSCTFAVAFLADRILQLLDIQEVK